MSRVGGNLMISLRLIVPLQVESNRLIAKIRDDGLLLSSVCLVASCSFPLH